MEIDDKKIKTSIGALKITRNMCSIVACLAPAGGVSLALTTMQDNPFMCIVTMAASGATLAFNTYTAVQAQREIKKVKEKTKN